jgi:hypothetical protein
VNITTVFLIALVPIVIAFHYGFGVGIKHGRMMPIQSRFLGCDITHPDTLSDAHRGDF